MLYLHLSDECVFRNSPPTQPGNPVSRQGSEGEEEGGGEGQAQEDGRVGGRGVGGGV